MINYLPPYRTGSRIGQTVQETITLKIKIHPRYICRMIPTKKYCIIWRMFQRDGSSFSGLHPSAQATKFFMLKSYVDGGLDAGMTVGMML